MKRIITLILALVISINVVLLAMFSSYDTCVMSCLNPALSVMAASPEVIETEYTSLGDTQLLSDIEDSVYIALTNEYQSEDFIIERVNAIYLSNEYLTEKNANSKENIYFGYSLSELNKVFGEQRYIFSLGDDGKTSVRLAEKYDDTYDQVIKNVVVGSGVILVFVTVTVLTGGLGMTSVSTVFAASAKSATTMALSTAAFSSTISGIIKGVQTKDFDEAIKAAALSGSEGFKWGAIAGGVVGGFTQFADLKSKADRYKEVKDILASTTDEWRLAEYRAYVEYGGKNQVSYLAGDEVPLFTSGATRPDLVRKVGNHLEAIEVKYYNLESELSRETLYRELRREVGSRLVNMPSGTTQRVVLDVTERGFSMETINRVKGEIWEVLAEIYPNIPIDVVGY